MFTFRYIGHFDLAKPSIKVSDYDPAVPNVVKPVAQGEFNDLLARFSADRTSLKWCYGAIISFLSRPGEVHPFERALIEEAYRAALNMRLEVICRPGVVTVPMRNEVWVEKDYLSGPRKYELRWCEEFYKRLVSPEDLDERPSPTLQGQLLYAATNLQYELASCGERWDEATEVFLAYELFVLSHLCDGTFDAAACTLSRRAMDGLNRWMNRQECDGGQVSDDLDKMLLLAFHWCRLHPEPLPPATVMWESPA